MLQKPKPQYDLEARTERFAHDVRNFISQLPLSIPNSEDIKQITRSSGSVGANYIEANESLSKKDFVMRIKICRKEAKESRYWLRLINIGGKNDLQNEAEKLKDEAEQLMKIFGAIIERTK